ADERGDGAGSGDESATSKTAGFRHAKVLQAEGQVGESGTTWLATLLGRVRRTDNITRRETDFATARWSRASQPGRPLPIARRALLQWPPPFRSSPKCPLASQCS